MVVVIMHDVMTRAGPGLAASGQRDAALALRLRLQRTMRAEPVAAVERPTGCTVTALMSDSHIDLTPDRRRAKRSEWVLACRPGAK